MEMEENLPNFDLGLGYLSPPPAPPLCPEPEEKKQKKEEPQLFVFLNDRELDDLIKGTQAIGSPTH